MRHKVSCEPEADIVNRFTVLDDSPSNPDTSLQYTTYKNFYANITFYCYLFPKQQQPWDPDFTYGFGYFDWHPDTISIQYNNYSGNRFPWKKTSPGTGSFTNGGFTISWSWAW